MIKVLITGTNSYVGTNVQKWLEKEPGKYSIDTLDMLDKTWKDKDFSGYDVLFHVAGIAHVSSNSSMEALYYEVNRDLAIQTAQKAKNDGIKQFIFMSSIIVYGNCNKEKGVININTKPKPTNYYGKSKLQAEEYLKSIVSDKFKVVILRPPMIYGEKSKGNYPRLSKIAKNFPVFPDIKNQRSMLHINNLCEFVKLMIDNEETGLFFPQNRDYVSTSDLVQKIAELHGNKLKLVKIFNPAIMVMRLFFSSINKAFGNLVYEKNMSEYKENYRVVDSVESIRLSEQIE